MTTNEALNQIPDIVARAIPLTPIDDIKCAAKRSAALQNALWRREMLADRIKSIILQHQPDAGLSMTIDLEKLGIDLEKLKD